jgi:bifunctional non-homologous end joining protein LigD
MRKANLERLQARKPEGIFINLYERGEIGSDLFRAAATWALRATRPSLSGPPVKSR